MASGSFNLMDDTADLYGNTTGLGAGGLVFDQKLVYLYDNVLGAKIYMDELNHRIIKIEDVVTPFEMEVTVSCQDDRYLCPKGGTYLITPNYAWMDAAGNIRKPETRSFSEPA